MQSALAGPMAYCYRQATCKLQRKLSRCLPQIARNVILEFGKFLLPAETNQLLLQLPVLPAGGDSPEQREEDRYALKSVLLTPLTLSKLRSVL